MRLEAPTEDQQRVAAALGIDISRDTRDVAAGRIHTAVGPAILSKRAKDPASERQVELGKKIGIDVVGDSSLVASEKIGDRLFIINRAAAEKLQLKSGDRVRVRRRVEDGGATEEHVEEFLVSSVQPNGRIMFKGGGCPGAWAGQVERIDAQVPD